MKVWTSFYGNLKNIPKDFFIIAASGGLPEALKKSVDYWSIDLAPNKSIYFEYKEKNDWQKYTNRFNDEILSKIDWLEKFESFELEANKIGKTLDNIVILCYESVDTIDGKGIFCHRYILAESIEKEFSTQVCEYGYENYIRNNYKLEQPFSADFLF